MMDFPKKGQIAAMRVYHAGQAENPGVKTFRRRRRKSDTARHCRAAAVSDALQAFLNGFSVDHEGALQ